MKALDEVLEQGMKGFPVKEFKSLINDDIIVLDTRAETEFVKGICSWFYQHRFEWTLCRMGW